MVVESAAPNAPRNMSTLSTLITLEFLITLSTFI